MSLLEQTAPNIVSLAVGVLEPRSELTLRVMVVNPSTPYLRVKVTSSLPGIPEPKVGASIWGQFAERFFPVVAAASFIVAAFLFVRSVRKLMSAERERRWLKISGALIQHVLAWVFGAFLLAGFLGVVAASFFWAHSVYEASVESFR